MKVVTPAEMARIEKLAYEDGADEEAFMEAAGIGVAKAVRAFVDWQECGESVTLLVGKGNNGGDAYAAGFHLIGLGCKVQAIQVAPIDSCSDLCQLNHQRFVAAGGKIQEPADFNDADVIVDGLFGTGFQGKVEGAYAAVINAANESGLPTLAIDIPSGLNGETGEASEFTIQADGTISLGLPKLGLFLQDGPNIIGQLRHVDFGLDKQHVEAAEARMELMRKRGVESLLPPLMPNRHKYQAGHVVGLAGSPGMPGAAMIGALAALRSGAGIVRVAHPSGMEVELAGAPFEMIRIPYNQGEASTVLEALNKADAVFVGPGMGTGSHSLELLTQVIPALESPCVLDADALNVLASEKLKLPKGAILTPHMGEMHRLLGLAEKEELGLGFLDRIQAFVDQHEVYVVLKGYPTIVFHPRGVPKALLGGDPGMATAGVGDALTGVMTALLAQGLKPIDSALLAVYLHNWAGEAAAHSQTSYSLIATDLIEALPEAFLSLMD